MPIPGNVVGDSSVEDSNELANIILDSLTLLDLLNAPFLIILSSSFFNIHTFGSQIWSFEVISGDQKTPLFPSFDVPLSSRFKADFDVFLDFFYQKLQDSFLNSY